MTKGWPSGILALARTHERRTVQRTDRKRARGWRDPARRDRTEPATRALEQAAKESPLLNLQRVEHVGVSCFGVLGLRKTIGAARS